MTVTIVICLNPKFLYTLCSDGATRSGLYAATSLAIDRMNCDDELDVLLSCRYITNVRPQAIATLVFIVICLSFFVRISGHRLRRISTCWL